MISRRLLAWLEGRWLPLHLAILAVLLGLPSLDLGLQIDDYFHRLALSDPPVLETWARNPATLFVFFDGRPELIQEAVDSGAVPWWTSPDLVLSFFRPISGLTHWLDWTLWPGLPALMHVQSLLWYAIAAGLATVLYRRLLTPSWLGGLAALLFVIDDGHGLPVVWLANRNALVAVVFGLLALVSHHRWRQAGHSSWALLSAAAILASVLGNEGGVAICVYIAAYALFFESGSWRRRLLSLWPAVLVSLTWLLLYHAAGFGAVGSAVYVEPMNNPLAFAKVVGERAPVLVAGQLGLPIDLLMMLSESGRRVGWLVSMLIVIVVGLVMMKRLASDRAARFLAAGMVLSVLPACATFTASRLLMFASIGGAAVVAFILADVLTSVKSETGLRRWLAAGVGCLLVFVHLFLSPVGLIAASSSIGLVGGVILDAAESLPYGPETANTTILVVNTPSAFITAHGPLTSLNVGEDQPDAVLVLGSGIHTTTVTRLSAVTVAVRMEAGFLAPPGTEAPSDPRVVNPFYAFQTFDLLYSRQREWEQRETVHVAGIEVEIASLTEDQRPLEVHYHFPVSPEGSSYLWLEWVDGRYEPFELPAIGEALVLGPVRLPMLP